MVVDATVPLALLLTGALAVVLIGHLAPLHLATLVRAVRRRRTGRPRPTTPAWSLRCRHVVLVDEPAGPFARTA